MKKELADQLGVEELSRRAQRYLARSRLTRDPERKAALLEQAIILEALAERAKAVQRL